MAPAPADLGARSGRVVAVPGAADLGASSGPAVAVPADPIVRRFCVDGRLAVIPARRAKRLLVLDWLAQEFEPGRLYSETSVNTVLRRYHPDFAALRRYLVDEGFMDRRDGDYWRTGGTFDVT